MAYVGSARGKRVGNEGKGRKGREKMEEKGGVGEKGKERPKPSSKNSGYGFGCPTNLKVVELGQ